MRRLIIAVLLIGATAVFAAARQDTKPSVPMVHGMMMNQTMMWNSPMNIPGVEVAVEDTLNGATVSFTTKTGNVPELRRVVRQHIDMMKNMHNRMMMEQKPASK
jgi:hypothetical protein